MYVSELTDADIKELLSDTEATGFRLPDVHIRSILESKPLFYGDKKSARREAFRKKFHQLRRATLQNYSKCPF